MTNVNECPECEGVDIVDGRLVGDMAQASRFSVCNRCGCEWVLHLKPDMLTVTTSCVAEFGVHESVKYTTSDHKPRLGDRRVSDDGTCRLHRRTSIDRRGRASHS